MTDRGELAYQAFVRTTGQKEEKFEDLPKIIQLAWANAAQMVVSNYIKFTKQDRRSR